MNFLIKYTCLREILRNEKNGKTFPMNKQLLINLAHYAGICEINETKSWIVAR